MNSTNILRKRILPILLFCQANEGDLKMYEAWKDSGFRNDNDAVCIKLEHSSWTFADVRGTMPTNNEP